jgi:hypothetical protein
MAFLLAPESASAVKLSHGEEEEDGPPVIPERWQVLGLTSATCPLRIENTAGGQACLLDLGPKD